MSTNAHIGRKNEDGTITSIYLHYDGYPSHAGRILKKYYNTPEKVDELLKLGDLSSIHENIGVEHDFNDDEFFFKNNQCKAYGRDRKEKNVDADTMSYEDFVNRVKTGFIEYYYIYDNGEWTINEN